MVHDDLMIRNNTVFEYKHKPVMTGDSTIDSRRLGLRSTGVGRSASVDRDNLPQLYSELGLDYSSVLPYGF